MIARALAYGLPMHEEAAQREVLYLVFPGSGTGRPRPTEEIKAEAEKLFQAWAPLLCSSRRKREELLGRMRFYRNRTERC